MSKLRESIAPLQPKTQGIITKCAVLLMGRNSVIPCMIPSMRALNISSNNFKPPLKELSDYYNTLLFYSAEIG